MPHVKVTIDSIRRPQLEKFEDKATTPLSKSLILFGLS